MSVKIRMRRSGGNKEVSFRIVATDSRSPRDGKFLEILGWYDPKKEGKNFLLKTDRIEHWVSKGAQVSAKVAILLKKEKTAAK